MATLSRLIFYPLLILFFLGKLFPFIDIFIVLLAITNLFSQKNFKIKNKYLLIFALIAIISNLLYFNIIAWLYLLRLLSLLSLLIFPPQFDHFQHKFLNIILFSNIIFGFIQYFTWPDFTIMSSQNWDPHLYRLVSTYFDPTFTGLIFLFILVYFYFYSSTFLSAQLSILGYLFIYIAIALTYSRSTFLTFIIVFSYISYIKKNKKIFIYSLIIFLSTLIILPRMPGEGTKLERTSSFYAKIANYQQGLKIFINHPITGIGYNNIPLLNHQNTQSHANSGFDGSLLTIAITTGILGLTLLILGVNYEFKNASLFYQSLLLAIFIHSLFANSLFYPYTFLLLSIFKSIYPVATQLGKYPPSKTQK